MRLSGGKGPTLILSKDQLVWNAPQGGGSPASQSVGIGNAGQGTLSWTATADAPWIEVTPSGTAAPLSPAQVRVSAGCAPGDYLGHVTFSAPGAANSPQVLPIKLRVGLTAQPGGEVEPNATFAEPLHFRSAG